MMCIIYSIDLKSNMCWTCYLVIYEYVDVHCALCILYNIPRYNILVHMRVLYILLLLSMWTVVVLFRELTVQKLSDEKTNDISALGRFTTINIFF